MKTFIKTPSLLAFISEAISTERVRALQAHHISERLSKRV